MKNQIINAVKLSRIFIVEQLREPLALFWSLIAPPLLFVFLNLDSLSNGAVSSEWYKAQASWYLSYLALSVSLFGFSMYLVGRRESGFMKSFIQGKQARIIFLFSQISASFVLSILYFIVFILLTTTAFGVSSIEAFERLALPFFIIIIAFLWGSLIVSVFPITFTNANSAISIVFMSMLIFSVAGLKANLPVLSYINRFNPLSIATGFVSGNGIAAFESAFTVALIIFFGGVGAIFMRTNPIWSRQ